ncbi:MULTISPECIES: lipopolysaccharide biosynthesis protein [unclassified Solwaraspora]|uniref:lipopolysaccharide biosynthesis protein n=1 Tax=unclassified Solwaraspora TaxID=2627926 RepID=UPI00259B838D|nr:lipopolysaccharide biosynthesis protein [Solwaraspora sp. WMMA2056]WJK41767.1 lipopolysaccharide biosynthesis protein [Solwaraspora sp. WMMA2056]
MRPDSRPLRRNLVSGLYGNGLYAAAQMGIVAVLARTTSTEAVGQFMLALAICGPIFALSTLKLRQIQATDLAQQFSFGHYLALRLITGLLAAVAVVVAAGALPLSPQGALVLTAVAVGKGGESIIDVCYGAIQQREQLQLVARSLTVRAVGGLLLFTVVVVTTRRVELAAGAAALLTIAQSAVEIARVRALGFDVRPRFDRRLLWRLAAIAIPLGIAMALASLLVNVPRYVLTGTHGTEAVGIFAALAYLTVTGSTVVGALALAVSPRLASHRNEGHVRAFHRLLWSAVGLGAALGLAGVLAVVVVGRPALEIFYGPEYGRHTDVLLVLMVAGTIGYATVFVGTALDAIRVFRVQLPIHLVAVAAVVVTSFLAVPRMGMMGAAVAVLVGALVKGLQQAVAYLRIVVPALRTVVPAPPGDAHATTRTPAVHPPTRQTAASGAPDRHPALTSAGPHSRGGAGPGAETRTR